MLGTIGIIAWAVFAFNGIALFANLSIGKFMFNSDIMFMRILMDPEGTSESVRHAAHKTIKHAGWFAISGAILFMLYF